MDDVLPRASTAFRDDRARSLTPSAPRADDPRHARATEVTALFGHVGLDLVARKARVEQHDASIGVPRE
jgi:hypothetical protein